jgi:LCP family protein required for cell wall assembly
VATVGAVALSQIQGNVDKVQLVGEVEGAPLPTIGSFDGGFNVLIVGIDVCESNDGCAGRGSSKLNDVNILLHVSQDQTNAVAVSFPRDLIVPIPSCPREDGKGNNRAMSARPLNEAYYYGGLPCVVLTIQELTDVEIPFAGLITFNGVIGMSSVLGGVSVCTNGPIVDKYSGLNIPAAGEWPLEGAEALAFLRSRKSVGDGSDLARISSQQVFMSSLVRKLKSEDTLTDPAKLFRLATTATHSMKLSNSLANVNTIISMAQVLKNLDLSSVKFVQYPASTGGEGIYAGKATPIRSTAERLFAKIRADEPFGLGGNTGRGSVLNPDAPVVEVPEVPSEPGSTEPPTPPAPELDVIPGLLGQSAADHTCTKKYGG